MPKRTRRKSSRPPPGQHGARRGDRPSVGRAQKIQAPGLLQYKVVELSTVDEGSLERTVNSWVRQGWNLENVQFAMRESSKRPSMAFVFFTRDAADEEIEQDEGAGRARMLQIAGGLRDAEHKAGADATSSSDDSGQAPPTDGRSWNPAPERALDPWTRLAELARDPEDPG